MERGPIESDPRHIARRMKTAMQGNAIRALVELITNADDSYIRMEEENIQSNFCIEINYKKQGYSGLFTVRDYAEGMSHDDICNSFKKYGAATSGMKVGKRVRGYFGQGAKDALASMVDGRICSFKNNLFTECKLFIENGKPMYEISDPVLVTSRLRSTYKIESNGTIASFKADPQKTGTVPQFDTVQRELANNCLLRKIMTNSKREIILINDDTTDTRHLRYRMPEGKKIYSDDFIISYNHYGDFPIHVSIYRSDRELTQAGEDRDGGLLILDNENIVLGISLFKFDTEPLASHFFGEVIIERFRVLLDNEETVLSEERDGLIIRHPFCKNLISEIEKRIEQKVKEEKLRKQKEEQSKVDKEEAIRYKKAFDFLNRIAEEEVQTGTKLGPIEDPEVAPPNGFCIYPSTAQITVGKRYSFQLHINTKIIPIGSTINVTCTNSKIKVLTPELKISKDDSSNILRKYISIEGLEPNIDGYIRATVGNNTSEAKVFVIPEKELLFDEGMVFQPETITLRPNQSRKVYLLVYIKIIEGGSVISISSDNDSIHISKNEIIVNEADAVRHVVKYELDVYGEGAGQDAIITASYLNLIALLDIKVRSKEELDDKGKKGMFNEPEFNFDPEPLQRTSYSSVSGKVTIYINFPSVLHYLGNECQYRKSLPAQVLIADLVAERCFHEIAAKKVEMSGAAIRPEAIPDLVQRDANDLSKKYGKKLHESLVDQKLLKDAKINTQT